MGRLQSPSRPDRRHEPTAWSACTVCWVLLAVFIACTGVVAAANPADGNTTPQTTVPTPDLPTPTPTPVITTLPPTPTPTPVITTLPPTPTHTTIPTTNPTTIPTTIPTTVPTTVSTTSPGSFPPSLILYPTALPQSYSVTVEGSVGPGTSGATITRINWNWGDGVIEDHAVPNSHTYAGIGSYTITVTAFQSDGQSTTRSMTIFVSGPTEATTAPTTGPPVTTTQPPLTVVPTAVATVGPPVLTLNPPLVNNQTVTIGGMIQPGGPNTAIDLVIWDWGDGIRDTQNTLPVTHIYRAAGEYTIGVEVIQSEVGAPEKRLTATASFPVSITQVPGTYSTGTPMQNGTGFLGGLQIPEVRLFGLNIFPLLVLLLVGLLIGGFLYVKSRESTAPDIPTTDAIEQAAAAYQDARERGDLPAAKQYAFDAARLLVIQAETVPKYGNAYLEKAEIWKEIARTIDTQPSGPLPEAPGIAAPVPIEAAGLAAPTVPNGGVPAEEIADVGGDLLAGTDVEPGVFDAVLRIALEIAREGREGKPVGTAFLVGDVDGVLAYSTQFILNPFKGHTAEERRITNEELAENIKEFALLDGAFVIGGDGVVEAAGRYITVDTSAIRIPAGLGSRHASVAGISLVTGTIGIVVSQSGGLIKIFRHGEIVRTVSPW
ncbi:MAG: diadenylate cyclase [Methanospirillum sp.]